MALPQVGTLYQNPAFPPPATWSQPGGAGTQVFPQAKDSAPGYLETPLTPSGQYAFGCGHLFNAPRVWEVYDDETDQQAALYCCPVCTYIQEIVVPYSTFLNYLETPIIIA